MPVNNEDVHLWSVIIIISIIIIIIIIIIMNVFRAINCLLHSPRTGANPRSWGSRGSFLFDGQKETFSVCAPFLGGWSFAAHSCYWLQGSFLNCGPFPLRHSLCPQSPLSRNFNLKIFVFWKLLNYFRRGVSVGWYRYVYKVATPVGMVLDHYIRLVYYYD